MKCKEAIVSMALSSQGLSEVNPRTMVLEIWDIYPIFHYSRGVREHILKHKPIEEEIKIKTSFRLIPWTNKDYYNLEIPKH